METGLTLRISKGSKLTFQETSFTIYVPTGITLTTEGLSSDITIDTSGGGGTWTQKTFQ
jgi:hypothetical protein